MLDPWKKSYDQLRQHIKKQRHYFANKGPSSQSYVFSSSHVWIWELDYKESWAPKNWCFWTVVLEKTLESPLACKEVQPVHPKGGQSWVFIGRTDAEAETPILWPHLAKSWLIGKDPDAGKDWSRRKRWWQRVRSLDGITSVIDMSLSKLWELVKDREAWSAAVHGVAKSWTWLSDWTDWLTKPLLPPRMILKSLKFHVYLAHLQGILISHLSPTSSLVIALWSQFLMVLIGCCKLPRPFETEVFFMKGLR